MDKLIEDFKNTYGNSITKDQFESIYDQVEPFFVEKYGEPERSFISVVSFGNKAREELKEILDKHGITVYTESYVDGYGLKTSGFNRLSEIQTKIK